MVALGDEAMPVVQRMLEDERWFVVRNAVAILGEIGSERAVELVVSTLAHEDARVRREGTLALAKVGGEDAGMLVYGMIEDPDPEVRLAAAMAAGELKVERALKPLLALLEEETDPDVVVGVLHALGQLGDPSAVNAIEKRAVASFFSRRPTAVRIAAYRALYRHRDSPREEPPGAGRRSTRIPRSRRSRASSWGCGSPPSSRRYTTPRRRESARTKRTPSRAPSRRPGNGSREECPNSGVTVARHSTPAGSTLARRYISVKGIRWSCRPCRRCTGPGV